MKGPVDSTPDELDLIYENLAKEGGHLTREQLLAIDLRVYEKLAVYPNRGVDWSLQRKKILFLQEAVNLDFAWGSVVKFTQLYFGQSLKPPPVAIPALTPIEPFIPPPFDSRKDPEDWAADCEKACSEYIADVLHQLREWQDKEIATGSLKRFERGRRTAGIAGQKKTAIANERQAMQWTAVYFLSLSTPNPVSWAQLATWFPASAYNVNPKLASAQKRRRADQIRKKVLANLKELGLPVRK